MGHHGRRLAAIMLALATFAGATAFAAPGGRTGGVGTAECGEGVVMHTPTSVWPPNHKMRTIVISYVETDEASHDEDTTTITVDSIFHDQADEDGSNEMNGSGRPNAGLDWDGIGNTEVGVDSEGPVVTTAEIRSERSGRAREGRTYTIIVTCSSSGGEDGQSATDTVALTVHVPHNLAG